MALGIQLYAAATGDKAALERWLRWVEEQRPCIIETPKLGDTTYCLVRGGPRWCTDDTEHGCSARPQDLATLAVAAEALDAAIPEPAITAPPEGPFREIVQALVERSRESNALLSLSRLLPQARELQPRILVLDATVNAAGYSRHLVAVNALLFRLLKRDSPEVGIATSILALYQPVNPFFALLAGLPRADVAAGVLAICPHSVAELPAVRSQWAWQRDTSDEPWKESNLWDFVFLGRLLADETAFQGAAEHVR